MARDSEVRVLLELTEAQCRAAEEYIAITLIDEIRRDVDIDCFEWVEDMIEARRALKEALDNRAEGKISVATLGVVNDLKQQIGDLKHQIALLEGLKQEHEGLAVRYAELKGKHHALLKDVRGSCDICGNIEACAKYPAYCINGSAWEWRGVKEKESVNDGEVAEEEGPAEED